MPAIFCKEHDNKDRENNQSGQRISKCGDLPAGCVIKLML